MMKTELENHNPYHGSKKDRKEELEEMNYRGGKGGSSRRL